MHLPFFSVIVKKDWERTEREMISNQVIQNSIDELRAITKVDLGVYDVEGMKVAAANPATSVTMPPPTARMKLLRSTPSSMNRR